MAINSTVIVGRLTRDPEVKQTQSGISVCNFTLAVDRQYKSGDERLTDFIDCVAWRHTADFLGKYFSKGDPVGVTGHIQTRNWETDDGQKRKAVEVFADTLSFVGQKRNSSAELVELNDDDAELPF